MELASPGLLTTLISFAVAITILVFVHEMGHYLVARRFGVRVEVFSIGFGPELFGWDDRHGTRWRVSLIPLGGYVRFFGDSDAASSADRARLASMTPEEREGAFHLKPLYQRVLIVAAGPIVNILFAVLIYAGLFTVYGQAVRPPVVVEVQEDSPAAVAGLQPGDRIVSLAGHDVDDAADLVRLVGLYPGQRVTVVVDRDGHRFVREVTLARVRLEDRFGNRYETGRLGVMLPARPTEIRRFGPVRAVGAAVAETVEMMRMMLTVVGQVIMGVRSLDDLGGPVKIAKVSGEQASLGLVSFVAFLALISVNLGLVNLFPIPMLDGGHLFFYAIEAVRGSPVPPRVQEWSSLVGLGLLLALVLLVTWNDLRTL